MNNKNLIEDTFYISEEEIDEFLRESNLFDNDYFIYFMQNMNFNSCEYILSVFLGKEIKLTTPPVFQKEIKNPGGRTVVFDVGAIIEEYQEVIDPKTKETKIEKIIKRVNIEVQKELEGANPERGRFHSAVLDTISLTKNQDFKDISENFIIFITETDYFGRGKPIYFIDRYVDIKDENGNVTERILYNDRSHIIYINGSYKGTKTELGKVIHDFNCKRYEDMLTKLKEPAKYLKGTEEGKKNMTSFLERIKMQAEEKAKIEIERIKKEAKENEEKIIKEAEKARKAEEKARKAEEKARKAEEKARKEAEKQAIKARKEAEKQAIKARKEAEKQAIKARKEAEKQAIKARKEAEKQAKQAEDKGKLEGMAESIVNNIKSLMETLNMTAEKAMEALKVPEEEHKFYLAKLNLS